MGEPRYRVGRTLGRTIYDGDTLIGMMDTPELGAHLVDALNAYDHDTPGRANSLYFVDRYHGRLILNDDGIAIGAMDTEVLAVRAATALDVWEVTH